MRLTSFKITLLKALICKEAGPQNSRKKVTDVIHTRLPAKQYECEQNTFDQAEFVQRRS